MRLLAALLVTAVLGVFLTRPREDENGLAPTEPVSCADVPNSTRVAE